MKKVLIIILCIILIVPALAAGGIYLGLQYQYRDTFMPGQFINSVYVANMTPDEVNQKLKEKTEIPEFVITNREDATESFPLADIGYHADYAKDLTEIKNKQTVMGFIRWFLSSGSQQSESVELKPVFSYDQDKLTAYLDRMDFIKDNSSMKDKRVEVKFDTYMGYSLLDNTQNMLSHDSSVEAIKNAIDNQIYEVDLRKEKCYVEPTLTPAMQDARKLWSELEPYMKSEITYKFGKSQMTIKSTITSRLLAKDEETGELLRNDYGHIYLDEKLVKEYVHELADQINTVGKPRTFMASRGETVTIQNGVYGSKINEKAELEYLMTALKFGRVEEHTPTYSQTPFSGLDGIDDIGGTYIEVDMSNQHMYYYVNGRLKLDTDVVTGNTSLGRGTPVMVAYVYMKQRNRTLRGEGYASFVNYWMPVYRGVGIHDASWRGKYGGNIYKYNGSHGCINTPKSIVSQLYDMVEIGTPVLLFY